MLRPLRVLFRLLVVFLAFSAIGAAANVPQVINFQGRLTDSNNNPRTGNFSFTFQFFDSLAGGNQLPVGSPWSETQPNVTVTNGVFNAEIGSVTPIPVGVFNSTSVYMSITVGAETLSPRETLVTSPFAFNAQTLTGLTFDTFVDTYTHQTVNGLKTFTTLPQSAATPTSPEDLTTKSYVDALGGSGALLASTNTWTAQQTYTDQVTISSNLVVNGGNVGIGTATPGALLDITGDGQTVLMPRKSTAGDPAGGVNGMVYYNSNTQQFRAFQAGTWNDMITNAATNIISNQDFLQPGATFYVSSGSVQGNLSVYGNVNVQGVTYSWPGSNASGVLTNNGSGTLTWVPGGSVIASSIAVNAVYPAAVSAGTYSNITGVGTIGTGVWQGTAVGPLYGGTGLNAVTTGDLIYGSGANTWSRLGVGSNGSVLTVNGGVPSWVVGASNYILDQNTLQSGATFYISSGTIQNNLYVLGSINGSLNGNATSATSATTATNLAGGGNGSLPYQSGSGTTAMLAAGSAGQLLQSNGAAAPSWVTSSVLAGSATNYIQNTNTLQSGATFYISSGTVQNNLYVLGTINGSLNGNATTATSATTAGSATTATNLAGGGNGTLPYQTGSGATAMLAAGSAGQILESNGAAAPSWTSSSILAGSATNYIQNTNTLQAGSTFYTSSGTVNTFTVGTSITLPNASVAPGAIAAGTLGGGVIASSVAVYSIYPGALNAGNYTNINGVGTLTQGTWNASTIGAQYGGTGANLSAGQQGAVSYFSANGVMGASAVGTVGQLLQSNGAGTPIWVSTDSLGASYILNQDFLQAGATFYVSSGTVAGNFTAGGNLYPTTPGSSGQVLQTNGLGVLSWQTPVSGAAVPSLAVYRDGVQVSSPTGIIKFYSGDFNASLQGAATAFITLNPATTDFIQNTSSLQSGATAYPSYLYVGSSASVSGAGGLAVTYGTTSGSMTVTGSQLGVNSVSYAWPSSNGSGVLTNNGGGGLTWAPAGAGTYIENQSTLQAGATSYPDFSYIGTSETVLGAGGLKVNYGAILGSATINNLSNNLPVQTNGSNQLVSAAINLSGSQVTGSLPAASVAAGSLGGSVIASSIAVNTVYPGAVQGGSYSINVSTATNLAGGANGSLPYQTGSGATTMLTAGGNGTILTIAGGVPTWASGSGNYITNTNTLQAGATFYVSSGTVQNNLYVLGTISGSLNGNATSATSATTATNLAGGGNGSLPYQTGPGATTMLVAGSWGQILQSNGAAAPSWVTSSVLTGSSTNYIQNTSSLQSGATAYPSYLYVGSSASVSGAGGLAVTYGVTAGSVNVNGVNYAWPGSNGSGVLTNNGGGGLTWAPAGAGTYIENQSTLQVGATSYPDFSYIGTSETVLGAGGLKVNYGAILGSATINNLSNNLPVQTNGSNQLVSAAINLSGSQVTGSLPAASVAAGSLGGSVIASSIAVNTVYPGAVQGGSYSINVSTATNLAGGANGSLPYQTGSGATTMLTAGGNGTILTIAGGVPTWASGSGNYITNTNTLQAGATFYVSSGTVQNNLYVLGTISGSLNGNATSATSATTATNLAGGGNGSLPYQTGPGATTMLVAGSWGQILQSNGAAAPSWVTSSVLTGSSTNYIQNTSSLQSGATAYPSYLYVGSSASVSGAGGLAVTYGVTAGSVNVNGVNYAWPGSNGSGVLTNNGGGGLTWAPAGAGTYIENQSTLQVGATAYPDFAYVGTSETVLGAGGLGVTYGLIAGSITLNGPVMSNGSAGSGGQVLQSNGAGAAPTWVTSSVLTGSSTNYIQNTNTLQAGATFYVSSGTVAGPLTVTDTRTTDTYSLQVGSSTSAYNLVVSTNGNVGIGTSAPGNLLHILKTQNAKTGIIIENDDTTANSNTYSSLELSNGTMSKSGLYVMGSGYTSFQGLYPSALALYTTNTAGITLDVNAGGPIVMTQGSSERMRVSSAGNIGIGTTAPATLLHMSSGIFTLDGAGSGINMVAGSSLTLNGALLANGSAGNATQVLQSNGNGAAPTWVNAASANSLLSSTNTWTAQQVFDNQITISSNIVVSSGSIAITNGQMGATIHQNGSCGGSLTVDWSTGNSQYVQLTGACTLSFINGLSGRKYTLILQQDGSGNRTVSWPAAAHFSGAVNPVLSATASATDYLGFVYNDVSTHYDNVAQAFNY